MTWHLSGDRSTAGNRRRLLLNTSLQRVNIGMVHVSQMWQNTATCRNKIGPCFKHDKLCHVSYPWRATCHIWHNFTMCHLLVSPRVNSIATQACYACIPLALTVSETHAPLSRPFPITGTPPADSKFNYNSIYAIIFDVWIRGETHSPLIGELNMFFMFFTQI